MKKCFIILTAVALAAVGCIKFEPETNLAPDTVATPAISVDNVADQGFTVTITPASGTGFYSYAVKKGDVQDVNATSVFKLGLSGSMAKGTANAAEKQTLTLTYTGLDMNASYTVYAVAASKLGCIGEVTSTTVRTSDTACPGISEDPDITGTKVTLPFSEAVTYSGKGVTVDFYAINSEGIHSNVPQGNVEDVKVTVSGSKVTIDCGSMPNGAYYAVNIAEGAFVDAVGNKCPAVESGYGDVDGKLSSYGITGRKATAPFKLDIYGGTPVTVVSNMAEAIWMSVPEDVVVYNFDYKAKGSITYETEEEGHSLKETYDIYGGYPDYGYGWNGNYNCALTYPNAGEAMTGRPNPARGSVVTITIPAFLTDIYGNKNAEFVIGPFLYSYGFTTKDVIGTYQVSGLSAYGEEYDETPWTFTIAESDDKEKGNVMVTSYYGFDGLKIYADFDGDKGEFTMPVDFTPLAIFEQGGVAFDFYTIGYYSSVKGEGNPLVLYMTKSGEFTDANDYLGYYYEAYAMPASGKFEDINADEDYLGNDYNVFVPELTNVTPAAAALTSFNSKYPVRMYQSASRRTFARQIVK